MGKTVANSKSTAKPRGKPWPKGVSGNPAGAPKRGESWREIIARIGEMTPTELADKTAAIAKQLRPIGDSVTMKEAVVIRVYTALMFEPNASLFNSFMERTDGKVVNPVDVTSNGNTLETSELYDSIIRKLGLLDQPTETSEDTSTNP